MARHWQPKGPKGHRIYKLQREAQRLAAEKGHTLGRFKQFSHGLYIAHCLACPAALGVDSGGNILYRDELQPAEHPARP